MRESSPDYILELSVVKLDSSLTGGLQLCKIVKNQVLFKMHILDLNLHVSNVLLKLRSLLIELLNPIRIKLTIQESISMISSLSEL